MSGRAVPRRSFLRKGIVGGALLVLGGAVPLALRSGRPGSPPLGPLALLSAREYDVLAAVAALVVPGPGAGPRWPSARSLDCAGRIDALMARAHPEEGRDFKRLLALFENGLPGLLLHGSATPFTRLGGDGQAARLEAWRHSRLTLLRSGYQALVRLVHATYFSSPEVYALVGYPGPPEVPQGAR